LEAKNPRSSGSKYFVSDEDLLPVSLSSQHDGWYLDGNVCVFVCVCVCVRERERERERKREKQDTRDLGGAKLLLFITIHFHRDNLLFQDLTCLKRQH
jgi:hypothetical protein